jgi:quinol monooxygenase YgiN
MASQTTYPGLNLEVTITVHPSNVPKFLDLLRPAYEAVIAEPECTFFEVFIDPEKPGVVHWAECWTKDKEWFFGVQMQKEYYKPYLAATEPLFVKDRKLDRMILIAKRKQGGQERKISY